jgi:hypothetical protein
MSRDLMFYRPALALAALLVAMFCAMSGALAQEARETEAQFDMNRAGVEAVIAGDFDRAIQLFKGSLALGELNITYLNLGRAHQRAGHCRDAATAYQSVVDAPKVASPTPREVEALARQFYSELERDCPGEIVVTCSPANIELYVNTRGPLPCDGKPMEVRPGEIVIKGVLGEDEEETLVTVKALERVEVSLTITPTLVKDPDDPDGITPIVVPEQRKGFIHAGNAPYWLAGGLVLFAGGVVFDTLPETGRNGRFDAMDFTPLPFYVVGGTLATWAVRELWFK